MPVRKTPNSKKLQAGKRYRRRRRFKRLGMELLESRRMLAADFGDLPVPYPTLLTDDGARHEAIGPMLGAARDADTNGMPSFAADGDDTSGVADEDGISWEPIQVGQAASTVSVNVQGGSGKLDAWIDFDGDGTFGGPGEQIFAGRDVVEGDNTLSFRVPIETVAGVTYARFRLSTAGGLGLYGAAADGEVEDYQLVIAGPAAATGVFSAAQTISADLYVWGLDAADIDGDGDLDVVSAAHSGSERVAWHENDGSGQFTTHVVSGFASSYAVKAADLDQDGDLDLLSAYSNRITWWINDGEQNFTARSLPTQSDTILSLWVADAEGDGDLDVFSTANGTDRVQWLENDGEQNFTSHVITTDADNAQYVAGADLDGDGDLDLLSASSNDRKLAWYENDGSGQFTSTHVITTAAYSAVTLHAVDLDLDGDMDVLASGATIHSLVWYENDGSGNFAQQPLDTGLANNVSSLWAGDIDGDGDLDVLATSTSDAELNVFRNDGQQNFTGQLLARSIQARAGIVAGDVDGDGDLDLIGGGPSTGWLAWYENVGEDYGDAPATYPTTLAADGPRHPAAGPRLGALVDDELDGVPSADADGDGADEDGVLFSPLLVGAALGATVTVDVQWPGATSGTAYLVGWVDFNADGDWDDADEHVFASEPLTIGQHTLSFAVPNTAVAGATYARFRISSVGGLGVTGPAADGEVEDYQVTIIDPPADYGDAPLPYPVTKAQNGARHVAGGPTLGAARDVDTDGVHSPQADADDTSGTADEDGVSFGTLQVGQANGTVTVNVQGGNGQLDAWIDFDGDGTWSGPGEQIFAGRDVVDGDNILSFRVPIEAVAGVTYARFRLSTAGGLGLYGAAADGEVEDYQLVIAGPAAATGVFSAAQAISTEAYVRGLDAADIDGDGDLDVLSAAYGGSERVAWHENDGSGQFTTHVVSSFASSYAVKAADLDQDGDLDLLSAYANRITWWVNDGNQNFTTRYLPIQSGTILSLWVADAEGDGDLDVFSTADSTDTVQWLENDGEQNFTSRVVTTDADGAQHVAGADLDGDGDLDLLSASQNDRKLAWYENDGSGEFTATHVISTAAYSAVSLRAVDLDLDGDMDVLASGPAYDSIVWYENDGSGNFEQQPLNTGLVGNVRHLWASDVDGDGDVDVLATSSGDNELNVFRNDGQQNFTGYFVGQISTLVGVVTGDVDGDGDLDLIGAGPTTSRLAWYENVGEDYGDAPAPYPTALAADGPRHPAAGPRLGALVDEEADGVPSTGADGDGADEDGVLFSSLLVGAALGATVTVDVQWPGATFGTAYLEGWVDFNADGDWADADEHVFVSEPLTIGQHTLSFAVPNTAVPGTTYTRFRISSTGGLAVTGPAADGEVEDYQVTIIDPPADYGDAPLPYPVTKAQNGARHVADGPTLGAARDVNTDGVHSPQADADDTSDVADEDGVSFGTLQVGQPNGTVTVNVQGGNGKLDAWIDFDGDGTWSGPGEQIFAGRDVVDGDNSLSFRVPIEAVAGVTNARFRLSTAGGLGLYGAAADGEVEDYQLVIAGPAAATGVFSAAQAISTEVYVRGLDAADIDGDGDLDVLSAAYGGSQRVAWHENDGSGQFTTHVVSSFATSYAVKAADLDQDGDLDLLSAYSNRITWWVNDGNQNFTTRYLPIQSDTILSLWVADAEGDGDLDVFSTANSTDSVQWLENDGEQNFTSRVVTTEADNAQYVSGADLDGDGDLDLLSASQNDRKLAWYENDGSGQFTSTHVITTAAYSAVTLHAVDLDLDGDVDVLASGATVDSLVWYDNDGSGNFTQRPLNTGLAYYVRSLWAGDIDGDGDLDVLATSTSDNELNLFRNDGQQNFTGQLLGNNIQALVGVVAGDMDGDGDLDLIGGGPPTSRLAWYENVGEDYGDSPAPYPTTQAADGPRHPAAGPRLGTLVDDEADGVPSTSADGDGADEDGVLFSPLLVGAALGASVTVDVQWPGATFGTAYLEGWIDFNADGDWDDADEHVLVSQPVTIGQHTLSFAVPNTAVAGTTYARFRISTSSGLGVAGPAADGEVEDYQVTILDPPADYGDAPLPYPVSRAQNAARHAASGPTLGANRDVDADGVQSPQADADDTSNVADEDGVSWGTIQVGQAGGSVTVHVQGGSGKLDAWIDFNGDGTWSGPGEQIFAGCDVVEGDNILSFRVPIEAAAGVTYARVRLSTAGGLGLYGVAADGEVEDYQLVIAGPAAATGVFSAAQAISTEVYVRGLDAADIDGDGDLDVLSAASGGSQRVAWHENDGSGQFTTHVVSSFATSYAVKAADLDQDGDLDLLSAYSNRITWWVNDGNQNFTTRYLPIQSYTILSLWVADAEGDGDLDVFSTAEATDSVQWLENDGEQNFTSRVITTEADGAQHVSGADLDGDGDLDLLSASQNDRKLAWYENDGSGQFTSTHVITTAAYSAVILHAVDLDLDGDVDVLASGATVDSLVWYDNDGSGNFTQRPLNTGLAYYVRSLWAGDIDGDGDLDVLATSTSDNELNVFRNDGQQNFTGQLLGSNIHALVGVVAGDVDGDGDLDLIGGGPPTSRLAWYENVGEDYGDAPAPYPTTQAADGPRHPAAGPRLGTLVDDEADGVPSTGADGDGADEDGVLFSPLLVGAALGASVTVDVQWPGATFGTAYLEGWIDFNADGDWEDADEHVLVSQPVTIGQHTLSFAVPNTALTGTTYARFRISSTGGLGVTGPAADGEVEDYQVTIIDPPADYGDAPLPYPVTKAENGARHGASGPTLGANRDVDTDGVHSPAADFDDTDGAADEDGVSFGPIQVGQALGTLTINVQGGSGKLDAWIDFNGDGTWNGPGERILADQEVSEGDNLLSFRVPVEAVAGLTFARFRLSTAGGLGPYGAALDGEVEDHMVFIQDPARGTNVFDVPQAIASDGTSSFRSVHAVDMDGDGDLDVLSGATSGPQRVAWHENDGAGNFTSHTIRSSSSFAVFAADMDGDGDLDVLAGDGNRVAWFDNNGQSFTYYPQASFVNSTIQSLYAADLDQDGDLDVVAGETSSRVMWLENVGNRTLVAHTLATGGSNWSDVKAADVDRDGDLDVVATSSGTHTVAWFENDGRATFTQHVVASDALGANSVYPVDLDRDGDLDLVASVSLENALLWYENDGSQAFTEQIIDVASAYRPNRVIVVDADGDGDLDVASASGDYEINLFINDGQQSFSPQLASLGSSIAAGLTAGDVDGDADIDLIVASHSLAWLEHAGKDYGDAPLPYPVRAIDKGASHDPLGPRFGSTRDIETDGQPSGDAGGDGDDEDGVTFAALRAGSHEAALGLVVENAHGGAFIDAWIDFNGDGVWAGPDEQIAARLPVVNGTNEITFAIPSSAAGTTYARLRISSSGGLLPTGHAFDGEVEDYRVTIDPPPRGSGIFADPLVISAAADGAAAVTIADLDRDGLDDVLSASAEDNSVRWHRNTGDGEFLTYVISSGVAQAAALHVVDLNGDGHLDVLSASAADDQLLWHQNDRQQSFTTHTLVVGLDGASSLDAIDFDADGDVDLISTSRHDDKIAWHENDGAENFTTHVISLAADGASSVVAVDVDRDGDLDIVAGSELDDTVSWFENDGHQSFTQHVVTTGADGVRAVAAADVDRDGRQDIISASAGDGRVLWHRSGAAGSFTTTVITASAHGVQAILPLDLDGDGDTDLLTAGGPNAVWYENDGSANWTARIVTGTAGGIRSAAVGDLDQDGDLDVVAASYDDDTIAWYPNYCSTTVWNTDDSGPGSLREAIVCANDTPHDDLIDFDLPGAGPHTISLLSPLPAINDTVIVDGTTAAGFVGAPIVELDGSLAGVEADGLVMQASGSLIRGLVINRFSRHGIVLSAGQTSLTGNYIGLAANGQTAAGNGGTGILVASSDNTIGGTTTAARNTISGNELGVHFAGPAASNNLLIGNYIGTNSTGTSDVGNTTYGVWVDEAANIQIGGRLLGQRNVISGNDGAGIRVSGLEAINTRIEGNYIGTDRTAENALANGVGVLVLSTDTTIGGQVSAAANVISGNTDSGISIQGTNAANIAILGNLIGTDVSGTSAVGNQRGIHLGANVSGITIGGSSVAQPNVISGNRSSGIEIEGAGNFVQGNLIGVDVSGNAAVGNLLSGVVIRGADNVVGTDGDGISDGSEGNVISGNRSSGVVVVDQEATGNRIFGNLIGTNSAGTAAVGNLLHGIYLSSAPGNRIGDGATGLGNTISGNHNAGILVQGSDDTILQGNFIGTDAGGSTALGNLGEGIWLAASSRTRIGTDHDGIEDADEVNVISANQYGIRLSGANDNIIVGNLIGTDSTGGAGNLEDTPIGNTIAGLYLTSSSNNQIGGQSNATSNLISGNLGDGIFLAFSSDNTITGNLIGVTRNGQETLGLQDRGIVLSNSQNNVVGGATTGLRNIISGHDAHGVEITGASSQGNQVIGNYIGVGLDGDTEVVNLGDGVRLSSGARNNRIGGTTDRFGTGLGNVIAGNRGAGVHITESTNGSGNLVEGNVIGLNAAVSRPIPNAGGSDLGGVVLGAPNNQVIGNLISGNAGSGILTSSSIDQAHSNRIAGNLIGTDSTGLSSFPNTDFGIFIQRGHSNTVGGLTLADRNVISGNSDDNIRIAGPSSTSNVVIGNHIGVGINGTTVVSPPGGAGGDGIEIVDASGNRIGGSSLAQRNVISGNRDHGVHIRGTTVISAENPEFVASARANIVSGNAIGTDVNGRVDIANGADGVHLLETQDNLIGGSTAAEGNIIAYNQTGVIVLGGGSGNRIRANAIKDNVGLGIDLASDGVTDNDPQDVDVGPNRLQNFPEITSATAGASTVVRGLFAGAEDVEYQLDFYAGTAADPSSYGEGARYLGSTQVIGSGSAQAFGAIVGQTLNLELITATATSLSDGTSEFSQAVVATLAVPPAIVEGSLIITVLEENSEEAVYGTPTTLVDEGTTVRLDGTFSTPNTGQVVTIDWKDGTTTSSLAGEILVKGLGFTAEHSYADDFRHNGITAPYEIRVTVTDALGSSGVASRPLTVTNIPSQFAGPLSISPPIIEEGQLATLSGTFIDPGYGDSQILTIDWNDGGPVETVVLPGLATPPADPFAPRSFAITHAFRDNFNPAGQAIEVTVTLSDGDEGSQSQSVSPVVFNVAPTLRISGPNTSPEGSRVTFSAIASDGGAGDVLSYQWQVLRDGEDVTKELTGSDTPSGSSLTLTPLDETTLEVSAIVRDDEGAQATAHRVLNVTNAAPVLRSSDVNVFDTSGGVLSEGEQITLRGLMNDPGLEDSHSITIRWGDADANGQNETVETLQLSPGVFNFEFSHTYPDDDPTGTPTDEYTITIEIDDGDGGVIQRLIPVTIHNTPPDVRIIDAGTDQDFIRVRALVEDNPLDTLSYQWSVFDPSNEPGDLDGVLSTAASLVLDRTLFAGFLKLVVLVQDDDTGIGQAQTIFGGGSNTRDTIRVIPADPGSPNSAVTVTITSSDGAVQEGTFDPQQGILIAAGDSDDVIDIDASITVPLSIDAGVGNDVIRSGSGADYIDGGPGNDVLMSGDGDDTVVTAEGDDTIYSGAGNDRLVIRGFSDKTLVEDDNDQSVDTLDFSFVAPYVDPVLGETTEGVTLDLSITDGTVQQVRTDGRISLTGTFENIIGTSFSDFFSGNSASNLLFGGLGSDSLYGGGGGDDTLDGGDGDDTLIGSDGNDLIFGGTGNDSIFGGDGNGNETIFGGEGNDIVISGFGGDDSLDGGIGDDSLIGHGGNDLIFGGLGNDTISGGFGNLGNETLVGGEGDDLIIGNGSGADLLDGGLGDDTLIGSDGNDLIFGGVGNDSIRGGSGSEVIDGGDGDDIIDTLGGGTLAGGMGNDLIFGGYGNDTIYGGGGAGDETIDGGAGDDSIFVGGDSLAGNGGNDLIFGGMGNDTISGAGGNEIIDGGSGDDVIVGTRDTLIGGQGNDIIFGGPGNDTISGASGSATISGGDGDDLIIGSGPDTLLGSDGNDLIFGGYGNDTIYAGAGTETIQGGDGDDLIIGSLDSIVSGGGNDLIFGGFGNDTIQGGIGDETLDGGDGDDLIIASGPDSLLGSDGNDLIFGGFGNDTIYAGAGSETIRGGDGNDVIVGSSDTLVAGAGNDLIFGGAGNDTIRSGIGDESIDGGAGDDLILGNTFDSLTASGGNDLIFGGIGNDTIYAGSATEHIDGGAGDDLLIGSEDSLAAGGGNDLIFGGTGNDTISGGAGSETLDGGAGDDLILGTGLDSLVGSDGNDLIFGGFGNDTIYAGGGTETIDGGAGDDLIIGSDDGVAGGAGDDSIQGGAGNDTISGGSGNETLDGGAGDDVILGGGLDSLVGADGNDLIFGGIGNDTIYAGGGNEIIDAGDGDDLLVGSPGDGQDTIHAGAGNDTLDGGDGNDLIFGGPGEDTFRIAISGATLFGNTDVEPSSERDALLAEVESHAVLIDGQLTLGTAPPTRFSDIPLVRLAGNDAANRIDATGYTGDTLLLGGDGNDTLLGGSGRDTLIGGRGDDDLDGGGADDRYVSNAGDSGLKTITERPSGGKDTLDFSLLITPVIIDLASSAVQTVTPGLDFALTDPEAIENGYGTAFNDRIYGNSADNELYGLGGTDELVGREGDDVLQAGFRRVVVLDFDSETDGEDHVYTSDDPDTPGMDGERFAIAERIRGDYAAFDVVVYTQDEIDAAPVPLFEGPSIRIVFNAGLGISEGTIVGGRSERLGWRELAADGTVLVNVNDFLGDSGNRLPGTSANYIALSSTVASHELAHMYGLRHHDAFGPIGSGIFEKHVDYSLPRYGGPRSADQTDRHLIASPASVGTSLIDALGDPYFGEREAIKLAFLETGQTVTEAALPSVARTINGLGISARALGQLATLAIPATTVDAEPILASAINVVGNIERPGSTSESDYYSFEGTAGDVVTIELLSQSLIHRIANIVDSVVRVYGPDGQLLDYHNQTDDPDALGAFNDNGFEGIDALLLDVPLPVTGSYIIEVDSFSFDLDEAPAYLPEYFDSDNNAILCAPGSQAVYCTDADTGGYEMFIYRVADPETTSLPSGDTLNGGLGSDRLIGNSGQEVLFGYDPDEDVFDDSSGQPEEEGRPPVISPLAEQTVNEGQTLTATVSAIDPDGDPLQWHLEAIAGANYPSDAQLLPLGDNSARFTFTPSDDGTFSVRVVATDPLGITGALELQITSLNAPPSFELGGPVTIPTADLGVFRRSGIPVFDPGDDILSGTVDFGDGTGEQPLVIDADTNRFDLDHQFTQQGTFTVTVWIDDGDGGRVSDEFEILVQLNTPPVAQDDHVSTDQDTALTFSVLQDNGNGADTDAEDNLVPVRTSVVSPPDVGQLTNHQNGSFTFDPAGQFASLPGGQATAVTFRYRIEDVYGETAEADVTITVTGLNDAPTLDHVAVTTHEDAGQVTLDLLELSQAADLDAGDTLTLAGVQQLGGRPLDLLLDSRSITFDLDQFSDLAAGVSEQLFFEFTVQDSSAAENATAQAQLTLTIEGHNDDPTIAIDHSSVHVVEGQPAINSGVFADFDSGDDVTVTASIGAVSQVAGSSGGWNWSFDAADSDQSQTVTLTAVDGQGAQTSLEFDLVISNADPVITDLSVSAPLEDSAQPGDLVQLMGAYADPGSTDLHRVVFDWDDGEQTVIEVGDAQIDAAQRTFVATHTYATGGLFEIIVTLHDDDGGSTTQTIAAFVSGVRVSDVGVLQIIGMDASDKVTVRLNGKPKQSGQDQPQLKVEAKFGTTKSDHLYNLGDIYHILMYLGEGQDIVEIHKDVMVDAEIHGGAGDDKLTGGGGQDSLFGDAGDDKLEGRDGNDWLDGGDGHDTLDGGQGDDSLLGGDGDDKLDGGDGRDMLLGEAGHDKLDGGKSDDVLVGGDGDDKLDGGDGRDVMIGGLGGDKLDGGRDEDLLIGARTLFDSDPTALGLIMAEWRSERIYEQRLDNLRGTGSEERSNGTVFLVPNETVLEDQVADKIDGGKDRDWYFAVLGDEDRDRLKRLRDEEIVDQLLADLGTQAEDDLEEQS